MKRPAKTILVTDLSLHRRLKAESAKQGITVIEATENALKEYLDKREGR